MANTFSDRLKQIPQKSKQLLKLYHPGTLKEKGWLWASGLFLTTAAIIVFVLSLLWGQEPEQFDVRETTLSQLNALNSQPVTGAYTTVTLITVIETLLNKPGGYLANDILPPGVLMDNIPSWEYGVLIQSRDLVRAMRNDISRSQSQSRENPYLAKAEPHLNFSSKSWILPSTESEYRKAVRELKNYLASLVRRDDPDTQFYARADNLRDWLALVEKRLGNLSQQLSASVGQERINTDLAGEPDATQATQTGSEISVHTPWSEIDNVFYQARGSTWALIHFLKAIEIDFESVLKKKNALISLRQIIRELEASQQFITSPVVLNGRGFGIFANYSLVMASYISRANAAVIDLRDLLAQG